MGTAVSQTLSNERNISNFQLQIDGTSAASEVMHDIMSLTVEQTLHLPSMFVLKLHNDQLKWFDRDTFGIGKEITIGMGHDRAKTVFKGEITALELDGGTVQGAPTLTVRGYDKLHRLLRGRKTRSFNNVSISDLVSKIAKEGGVSANAQDTGEVFEYILQNNESNLEFLQRWAYRIGMELFLDISKVETVKLRKLDANSLCGKITWGEDLHSFNGRMTASDQIDQVIVRGWNIKSKQAIVGTANSDANKSYPKVGAKSANAASKSAFDKANTASVYRFVNTQSDANNIAKAIYDDLAGRGFQADGSCIGNPDIMPGKWLEIAKMGQKYSGKYYITSCTHRYSPEGYLTFFEANGRQSRTLLELTNQAGPLSSTINGVVIGIVTSNNGEGNYDGWVKVKFPWLPQDEGKDIMSDWARVATPMGGNGRGIQFLPEVNDEVLVAFEHGDPHRPYVVGALWNGQDKTPLKASQIVENGNVNKRIIKTRAGHTITFDDKPGQEKISIIDKSEKNKIIISTSDKKITIETDTGGEIELKSPNGTIKMEAKDINIKGTQSAKIDTVQLDLKGSQSAKMAGTQVEIKGDAQTQVSGATTKVSGSAMVEVSGGVIKLN